MEDFLEIVNNNDRISVSLRSPILHTELVFKINSSDVQKLHGNKQLQLVITLIKTISKTSRLDVLHNCCSIGDQHNSLTRF